MNDIFRIVPPKNGPYFTIIVIGFILFVVVVLLLLLVLSGRRATLTVTATELRVQSLFYSAHIPLQEIETPEISQINLSSSLDKVPTIRLFGLSIAGFQLGWFRLKDGTKALLFVTDRSSVVYIPTKDYAIIASVNNPMALKTSVERAIAK